MMIVIGRKKYVSIVALFILTSACSSNAVTEQNDLQNKERSSLGVERTEPLSMNGEGSRYQSIKLADGKQPRGVALVIHGLNIRPEAMGSIVKTLSNADIETMAIALSGHDSNVKDPERRLEQFKGVTYQQWQDEIYEAFGVAQQRAHEKGVPLFLVGYSIGGLLGCDLMLSKPDVTFDRMVLFAPALAIRPTSHLLGLLSPFPNLVIPSFSPASYRANAGTPVAAYNVLYESVDHFSQGLSNKINVPTLVFVDEDDELVSSAGLVELIKEQGLTRWTIDQIKKGDDSETRYRHLVVDAASLGTEVWGRVKRKLLSHLIDPLPNQSNEKSLDLGKTVKLPATE